MATGPMQLHKLIERLLDKTKSRKLEWTRSIGGLDYTLEFGGYSIALEGTFARKSRHPLIAVSNKHRVLVETGIGRDGPCVEKITRLRSETQRMLDELWEIVDQGDTIEQLLAKLD